MTRSISLHAAESSRPAPGHTFLQRRWWRSVIVAAERQCSRLTSCSLCAPLDQPCTIAHTDDGELALEFGAPPLVVLSSDVALLPAIRADVQRLRRMRFMRLSDPDRTRLAQINRAGLLLIDALEQLADGLAITRARPGLPYEAKSVS